MCNEENNIKEKCDCEKRGCDGCYYNKEVKKENECNNIK